MIEFLSALKQFTHQSLEPQPPAFLFNPEFTRSHQSNLVRKDSSYYGRLFPSVPNDLPYLWPVQQENGKWEYILGIQRETTVEPASYRPSK
jgi:hypothetical protein